MIRKVRDYKIVSKIGEGGMGTVYLADDIMLERKVAVKVLSPLLTKDKQFTERFRHEAKVQASLIHPNIVGLYNFFQEDDTYCMVMEYVDGDTLKHIISNTGPVPEQRAIWILSQMLEAVGFAHKKGIIHRDIKPGNILIGKDDTVKILDFGIAKILQEKGLTKTGTKMGTIYYMSPEQIKALKDIDHRTDIYSLGVTFYEMLSGRVPFNVDTDSDFEIMNEIVTGEIKDPREFYPHISEWVVNTLFESVEKDRDKRIQTVKDFMNRLLSKEVIKEPVADVEKTIVEPPVAETKTPPPPVQEKPVANLKKEKQKVTPPKPSAKDQKKSPAKKIVLFGIIGALILVVALFLILPESDSFDPAPDTFDETVIYNEQDPGPHGPSRPEYSKDDKISSGRANWPAAAMVSAPR